MSSTNKTCSIAFTLPISCQICLGKVKQPVVCPNQHVFCQVCMEFWLSRSSQCPSCRIQINKDNPCKPVLGGRNEQQTDCSEEFSNRDMRRTRVEVLFKDYENEIERLERQNELLKEENKLLSERLSKPSGVSHTNQHYGDVDTGRLKRLIKKLQDSGDIQEKQKREIKTLREENKLLKEESGKTGIENQKLRMEVVSRSPRRYGRSTVVAMESELDKSKKQCSALNKALEKSDAYVEDLEKELDKYKMLLAQPKGSSSGRGEGGGQRGEGGGQKGEGGGQRVEQVSSKGSGQQLNRVRGKEFEGNLVNDRPRSHDHYSLFKGQRVKERQRSHDDYSLFEGQGFKDRPRSQDEDSLFDSSDTEARVKAFRPGDDTFELELPSPVTKGSKAMSKLVLDTSEEGWLQETAEGTSLLDNTVTTDNDETLELPSPVQSAKKRLRFSEKLGDSERGMGGSVTGQASTLNTGSSTSSSYNTKLAALRPEGLTRTSLAQSNMNTSMSGDIEDCMKLLEDAERKVERRRGQGSLEGQGEGLSGIGLERLSTAGVMVNTHQSGSSTSLTTSADSGSTLTLGHMTTEALPLKPGLFASSLPLSKSTQAVSGTGMSTATLGAGSTVMHMGNTALHPSTAASHSGNFQSYPNLTASQSGNFKSHPNLAASQSGNFPSLPNALTSHSGNFLSQPNSVASLNGNLHGKYSASNPFVNSLSQESRRF